MKKLNSEREINPHFHDFLFDWNFKYYFLVGGYGSSKSYNVATKIVTKLCNEKRTCLVVREVYETIRDSCYMLFNEIIDELNLNAKIKLTVSPLQIKFKNGSKIIFRGLDKPQKLKSIHNVSIIWVEECSEIKYDAFKELIGRLRHPTLELHMILSTNPVNKSNWTYKYFFEVANIKDIDLYKNRILTTEDTYYHHSIIDDNYFLPSSYKDELEKIKKYDPDLYRIARLGQFGTIGTLVFPQFEVKEHYEIIKEVNKIPPQMRKVGMDFGFITSYNCIIRCAIDHNKKYLYIYFEYYNKGLTDDKTALEIQEFKRTQELIKSDSAEPKTIAFFRQNGFNMKSCKKFPGSRLQYTKKLKRFHKIYCSDICKNSIEELKNLTFKIDRNGNIIEDDFNIDSHVVSALMYALDDYEVSNLKGNFNAINLRF